MLQEAVFSTRFLPVIIDPGARAIVGTGRLEIGDRDVPVGWLSHIVVGRSIGRHGSDFFRIGVGKHIREHGSETETSDEDTRGINTHIGFNQSEYVVPEFRVIWKIPGTVSISLQSNIDARDIVFGHHGLDGIESTQIIPRSPLFGFRDSCGGATHAVIAENQAVGFVFIVVGRNIDDVVSSAPSTGNVVGTGFGDDSQRLSATRALDRGIVQATPPVGGQVGVQADIDDRGERGGHHGLGFVSAGRHLDGVGGGSHAGQDGSLRVEAARADPSRPGHGGVAEGGRALVDRDLDQADSGAHGSLREVHPVDARGGVLEHVAAQTSALGVEDFDLHGGRLAQVDFQHAVAEVHGAGALRRLDGRAARDQHVRAVGTRGVLQAQRGQGHDRVGDGLAGLVGDLSGQIDRLRLGEGAQGEGEG